MTLCTLKKIIKEIMQTFSHNAKSSTVFTVSKTSLMGKYLMIRDGAQPVFRIATVILAYVKEFFKNTLTFIYVSEDKGITSRRRRK